MRFKAVAVLITAALGLLGTSLALPRTVDAAPNQSRKLAQKRPKPRPAPRGDAASVSEDDVKSGAKVSSLKDGEPLKGDSAAKSDGAKNPPARSDDPARGEAVTRNFEAASPNADTGPTPEAKTDRWEVDGSFGVPKLKGGELGLALDGTVAYAAKHFGGAIGGGYKTYNLAAGDAFSSTSRARLALDGFYRSGSPGDAVRFEGRADFNFESLQTAYISVPTGGGAGNFSAEGSSILRMSLLGGVLLRTAPLDSLTIHGGIGVQTESYGSVSNNGGSASGQRSIPFVVRTEARYSPLPGKLAVRPEVAAQTFSLTRSQVFVGAGVGAAFKIESLRQVDFKSRVTGDLDLLAFFGFVPNAFVGLDFVYVTGDAGNTAALLPLAGIGLTRPSL